MSEARQRFSTTTGTGNICCPFFVAHKDREIMCEGVIEGSRGCMVWQTRQEKEWHQQTYCENQFKRCEQYCSVMHWRWTGDD